MADIEKLQQELINDPLGRGYSGMTDQQVADDLNTEYRTRNRGSLSGDEIFQQTVPAEYAALANGSANNSSDNQSHWLAFCGRQSVDPFASNNIEFVRFLFGVGSQTQANIAAIRVKSISRAVELNLLGRSPKIGPAHVTRARAL